MRNFPLTRPGLTARMILQASPPEWHRRARNVRVSNIRQAPAEAAVAKYQYIAQSTHNDDGSPRKNAPRYKVTIVLLNKAGHVQVDCECLAHPFWGGEVSLYMRKAAQILRSNGRPPRVRNPELHPWGCKHILAGLKALVSTGKLR